MATIGKVSFCDRCRQPAKPAIHVDKNVYCTRCIDKVMAKRKYVIEEPIEPTDTSETICVRIPEE